MTLLDGIDTEAELSMLLSMFDKFNIRGNYQYIKTATGYKVKKVEFEYPNGDTIPRNTYMLDISQNGKMHKELVDKYIQVYPKGFLIPPTPLH